MLKWPDPESNWGHPDFQSGALPPELSGHTFQRSVVSGGADGI